jgi:DNA-binding protein YbaB
MPGATTEDRQQYLRIMQQSQNNLDAIAKWSVLTESNKNSYALHQQAVESDGSLHRLERGALNNKDLIAFENALLSETTENVSISQGENGGTVISITSNGQTYTRNITDDIKAFAQTGETMKGSAISEDELLTGRVGKTWVAEASRWKDLKSKQVTEKGLDEVVSDSEKTTRTGEETIDVITGRQTLKAVDIEEKIINDHDDFLESKIKINFSKNWDQLCYLGDEYVPEGTLRDLSWGTLNNPDWESGVANLRAQVGDDALAKLDPTGGEFDEDDYLVLQSEQRTLAKNAMAKFIAGELQQQDAVVAENITRTPILGS